MSSPSVHLSLAAIAAELGSNRDTIVKRLTAANVKPSGKRAGYPVYRLRDVLAACYTSSGAGDTDPEKLKPFERHAFYKAEREKLQLQIECSELVSSSALARTIDTALARLLERIGELPDLCGDASPLVRATIEARVAALFEQLHRMVLEHNEEPPAAG